MQCLALVAFGAVAAVAAEAPVRPAVPIHIESEDVHYDLETGIVESQEKVLLKSEDMEMELPGIAVDMGTGQVSSTGAVFLRRRGAEFTGQSFGYNYTSGTGTLRVPAGYVSGVHVTAAELGIENQRLILRDVKASTCEPEHLDYHLAAKSIEILPGGKVTLKGNEFYLGNFRVMRWPSYSFSTRMPSSQEETGRKKNRSFSISPPRFGYNHFGGVLVGSVVRVPLPVPYGVDAHLNYFLKEGFFPEMVVLRENRLGTWRASAGKQWKENTGFFRYLGPIVVWSMPNVELEMKPARLFGVGNPFYFNWETGRMRDSGSGRAMTRAVGKMHYAQPVGSIGNVKFHLISDVRGALYSRSRKYSAAGLGLSVNINWSDAEHFRVQYMNFDSGGTSPLFYDRVDPNDKWFANTRFRVAKKLFLTLDARYDPTERLFDEVEYRLTREYNCTSVNLGWRKERSQLLINYRIQGLPKRRKQ